MTIKSIVVGTILTAACTLPICFADSNYTLATKNNLDTISTLSINGLCSDNWLVQLTETCDSVTAGQTPAHGQSNCSMPLQDLHASCGDECSIVVYGDTGCKEGSAVGTGTLNVDTHDGVTSLSIETGNVTYDATDNYHGTLTIN